jgi:hypothetical protein
MIVPGIRVFNSVWFNNAPSIEVNINVKIMLNGKVATNAGNPQNASYEAVFHISQIATVTIKM